METLFVPPARVVLACAVVAVLCAGCTTQQLYEALLQRQRSECLQRPPQQQTECLDAVNIPYDAYRRERMAVLETTSQE
jgi:hypothetical protein